VIVLLKLIEIVSIIVPRRRRSEWIDEWHAEIWYVWTQLEKRHRLNVMTKTALMLRSAGAVFHALWLRKQEWRLEMLFQDLMYGLRILRKKPAFATVAIVVLALGIGANTAIFSVVYSVLLRPLPFKDPDRLVMVFSHNTKQEVSYTSISADDLLDFQKQNDVFDGLSGVTGKWQFTINMTGEAEQIFGLWVSSNFFDVLGVQPQLGRAFTVVEDTPGANPVVILSYEMWQRRFGGDENVLSKTLTLGGVPARVIGVMPRGFRFNEDADILVPGRQNPISARGRNVRYLNSVARLKSGVTLEQAAAAMRTLAANLEKQYPDSNTGFTTDIRKLHEQVTGEARPTLLILLAAVGFVLLIACANVANLMLVRAADRQREVAVRTALGADRSRLIKQLLTESVLLSVIGAGVGVLIAEWGIRYLISIGPNIPRLAEIHIDGSVLGFTFLLSILTGVVFGLFPALQTSRSNLNETLKESGRGSSGAAARHRFRNALVVSEVALALVLLVGSGLLIRSFMLILNVDPGYRTQNIVLVNASVPPKYSQPQQRLDLYYSLEEKLKSVPGVISVGAVSRFPLSAVLGTNNVTSFFMTEGHPVAMGERPEIDYRIASTEYFETMGIPLIRGRKFTRDDSTAVAIVNEAAVRKFWSGENPVGTRMNFGNPAQQAPWVTIVGVVGNVRHLGLEVEPRPEVYRPYGNNPLTGPMIAVRTAIDPHGMTALLRSEVHSVEKDMPMTINSIDQLIDLSIAQRRFSMLLLAIFAGVAMILAIVGIYGVMSYAVSQRTHEIGLRMALGAETRQVLKMVVREGLVLTSIGVAIGVTGAAAATRVMGRLLFGVTSTDPITYLGVSALLIMVALAACYIPARRASRVDPLVALRHE
jgi:predicted permease